MPTVNRADVVDDLRKAFEAYETALRNHDVERLNSFFWSNAQTLRYGIAEHSQGIEAIRRYRKSAPPVHPGRRLHNTVITTVDDNYGSVCTEFSAPDTDRIGRQTQTWVRFDEGWKIIAAHVSAIDADCLGQHSAPAAAGARR